LAVVLASIDGNIGHAMLNIGGGLLYVSVAIVILRPLLSRYAKVIEARGTMLDSEFVGCLILFALGSWITDWLGLHAVLGAFVMGMVMPRGMITQKLTERIEPFTMALLLPLFFTYSGLNTKLDLLDSGYLWLMAALVLFVAISGKGVACWIAARITGVPNREALGIGILMNTRGLMELIIITIGLQKGIISPALFAVLVVMAVVTTLMTSPTFAWFVGRFQPKKPASPTPSDAFSTNNTDLTKSIPIP
jgi:Kef-type K+ transport system membrane component KefB